MLSSLALASSLLLPHASPAQGQLEQPPSRDPIQHLVRLPRTGSYSVDMTALDVVAWDGGRPSAVIVTDEELDHLRRAGVKAEVWIEDLASHYADRLQDPARQSRGMDPSTPGASWDPPFSQGSLAGNYTFPQIVSVLDQVRADYPDLVTAKVSIGTSVQGRHLWMIKVSDNPDEDESEPEVLIDALHHGREPQSMQSTMFFLAWLLESYGSDPVATYLVNEREIYFVPCVNPDGYEYNRFLAPNGGGLWRKNRRSNGGGLFGVDLNRNYPFQWATTGSTSDPASIVYHGPSPGSEPEVQAMIQLVAQREFRTALTVHSFANAWLAPLSWVMAEPADWDQIREIGEAAVERFGFTHAAVPVLLSEAGGTSLDYYLELHDIFTWAPEMGSSLDGFWPAQDRILPLAQESLTGYIGTAMAAGAWLRPEDLVFVDAGDGDGVFESGELVEVRPRLRNSGRGASSAITFALDVPAPGIVVADATAGSAAPFTTIEGASPMSFRIRPGTPDGTPITAIVTATEEGRPIVFREQIVVGQRVVASFNFEGASDEGWGFGTPNDAVIGLWTREDPHGNVDQPETDTTPGAGTRCWLTGNPLFPSLNLFFTTVTLGSTTLLSPAIDLSGAAEATVEFQRWFVARSVDVPAEEGLRIELSDDDGQTWVSARVIDPLGSGATRGWRLERLSIGDHVDLTSTVRLRVIATDVMNGSFIEAAIDDVVFRAVGDDSCPLPVRYCEVSPNGATSGSSVFAAGSQSLVENAFELAATGTPAFAFGIFFAGDQRDNAPLGNGRLCVGGSIVRAAVVQSDGAGFTAETIEFTSLSTPFLPGQTWNFQLWHRDTIGTGINTSDAVVVVFCP
ncbi:MAG: M14 family zinc carboxypeptidase [Planctomycetota bacterium]